MSALQQRTILVTRPAGLEQNLVRLLTQAGAVAVHLPVIEITAPGDDSSRAWARDHFDDFDIAIFISPTSVSRTLEYMDIDDSRCRLAAIGSRSQQALQQAGLTVSIQPQGHDSESLLQLPALQAEAVAGKQVVIFRGEDGRDALADTLRQRGAAVHYAAMYTRVRPDTRLVAGQLQALDAITISSNEGLQNLYDIVVDSGVDTRLLLGIPLFVPGERAASLARSLGFDRIVRADNATDQAMLDALETQLGSRV